MAIKIRKIPSNKVADPSSIAAIQYNEAAGAEKNMEVGRHLLPLTFLTGSVTTYTTSAATIRVLPGNGKNLAVYNNAGAIGSVVVSDNPAQAILAAGITDAAGHVGIPCVPGDWTYIACGPDNRYVIASAATLLVFLIDDNTTISQEASR